MISTPVFKCDLRVVPVPGEGVLLLSERDSFVLRGAACEQVARLVDGRRGADDIVAALAGSVGAAEAWHVLLRLEEAGHIEERDPVPDDTAAAFWQTLGVSAAAGAASLRSAVVRIFADGPARSARLAAALQQFGVGATSIASFDDAGSAGSRSDLDVVVTDDYLLDELLRVDAAARSARRPWLLARPAGLEMWIGPLFRPGAPACLTCLRHRLTQRRPALQVAARHDAAQGAGVRLGGAPVTTEAGILLVATEVARALAAVDPGLDGIWSVDVRDRSARRHRVARNPACPACGAGPAPRAAPVRLRRRPVVFDADGGLRAAPPDALLDACEHLISPIVGVVGSLTPAPGPGGVGRQYVADDVRGGHSDNLRHLVSRYRFGSAGHGVTGVQARASALGEALERYSGQFRGTELRVPGTLHEMGEDAIHPNRVAHYSERQYRKRAAWNARQSAFNHVPEPFDPDARIDWTPIWSLTAQRHRFLPTELLYYGPAWEGVGAPGRRYCIGDPNGCAAGSALEEAVLQAFLELVERDAVAVWWYNRLRRPAIDLGSFGDRWISDVAARYRELEREVVALDLTHDLGIPVFAALSHRRHCAEERILLGFGCHLDARIALQRALAEVGQMLAADAAGGLDAADDAARWLRQVTRTKHPWLASDASAPVRGRTDLPDLRCDDLLDGIECCRQRVEARGMEVLVLDQTRSDVGLPVVRVVVPGLRHFRARFGPGRLYDVPVRQGWLPAPVAEEEMNPLQFFW